MNTKCTVTIRRGDSTELLRGSIIAETTTHALVVWPDNAEVGEWFAKRGRAVSVKKSIAEEDME